MYLHIFHSLFTFTTFKFYTDIKLKFFYTNIKLHTFKILNKLIIINKYILNKYYYIMIFSISSCYIFIYIMLYYLISQNAT